MYKVVKIKSNQGDVTIQKPADKFIFDINGSKVEFSERLIDAILLATNHEPFPYKMRHGKLVTNEMAKRIDEVESVEMVAEDNELVFGEYNGKAV